MSERKMHVWTVQLQSNTGQVTQREVRAFWDPEHDLTEQSVRDAARIEAHMESGKRVEYAPISVEYVA